MANKDKGSLHGSLPGWLHFGADGKSAYQLAVENGFEGTVLEWLDSLHGPPGVPDPEQIEAAVNARLAENPPDDGADGGHYTPVVSQPDSETIQFEFAASRADMPNVEPVQVTLPIPDSGGNADEIYVLSEGETLDDVPDNVEVVIDPNGEADFNLSDYAKTEDIPTDDHINNLIASALAAMPDASEVAF